MHLIWYNSITKKYEYGSRTEFTSLKAIQYFRDELTILTEFPFNEKSLAGKVISELNLAQEEPALAG